MPHFRPSQQPRLPQAAPASCSDDEEYASLDSCEEEDWREMGPQGLVVGDGVYVIGRQVGQGVFKATCVRTQLKVEAHLEMAGKNRSTLATEARILRHMARRPGVAKVLYHGFEQNFHVLVTDAMGPSLGDIFAILGKTFSETTLQVIARQVTHRLEDLHSKNILHRDIRPANFRVGIGKNANTIYVCNFRYSRGFRDTVDNGGAAQTPSSSKRSVRSQMFASLNAQQGFKQSRRDDLESVGYMLMYFANGGLPWKHSETQSRKEKDYKIAADKASLDQQAYAEAHQNFNADSASRLYLKHCRSLGFSEKPDYDHLRGLFMGSLECENTPLDWQVQEGLQQ